MIVGPSVTECTAVGRSRNQRTVPKELSLTSRKVLAAVSRRAKITETPPRRRMIVLYDDDNEPMTNKTHAAENGMIMKNADGLGRR